MQVTFRVDASTAIGTGHVMRCMTLADALVEKGGEQSTRCSFVTRAHDGHLIDLIRSRGFEVMVLPDSPARLNVNSDSPLHAHWLGSDWQTDAEDTIAVLDGNRPDWLVVDHYALDARWQRILQPHVAHVMVLDDLADRPHDCDLLLDQNLGRSPSDYAALVPPHCQVLTGPEYALLRPEFAQWRPASLARRVEPKLQQLLITLGGVDKDNVTGQVLTALAQIPTLDGVTATVIMGPHAPWLDQVKVQAAQMPFPTDVAVGVADMAQRMTQADLCIGAAGSTSWERCCLGLPTILLVLAENQVEIAQYLHDAGAAALATPDQFGNSLAPFLEVPSGSHLLQRIAACAANVTQGEGAGFITHMMRSGS